MKLGRTTLALAVSVLLPLWPGVTSASGIADQLAAHPAAEFTIPMTPRSGSNESGAALLRDMPSSMLVVVKVDKPLDNVEPAEIVSGGCNGTHVRYHLEPLSIGETVSAVRGAKVRMLLGGDYSLIVRHSASDHHIVSCGTFALHS